MQKRFTYILGIGFVLLGGLALTANILGSVMGFSIPFFQIWRYWPLAVITVGLLFSVTPLLFREQRGLGALYIPGLLILTTGGILMFASLFNAWGIWSFLWPLEPLSLALGFALAAFWMRSTGMAIPAILIGINGLVLQFCAITGWWGTWSALWTVEPLAVGLVLLLIGVRNNHRATLVTGLSICGVASLAFFCMSTLMLSGPWAFRVIGPLMLIFVGVAVIAVGFWRRNRSTEPPVSPPSTDPLVGEGAA